jgi:NADPH:quinone reductase
MYMHLSRLQKALGLDAAFRYERHGLLHLFPSGFPKFVPQFGFGEIPVWFGFRNFSLARRRQTKEALSSVFSLLDANPALLPHPLQGPRQRRTVHYEAFAQPFLIHLAGYSQCREESELCNLEARLLQFLVINPRYDPRCAAKVLASARQVKERFGGGWFRCLSSHSICIYIYRGLVVKLATRLSDSPIPHAECGKSRNRLLAPLLLLVFQSGKTMQAYLVAHPDGAFTQVELTRPAPSSGKVLVQVHASGVNPLDTKIRAGKAAHAKQPLPAVLGLDMAGVVAELGPGVTAFHQGSEVYGMVGGVGGLQGTLAEYVVANADLLALKPKSLSMREAAALPLIAITAWEGIVDRAKVHGGQNVLVHAGAGGVGHIVVQLAKAFGAEVFATVSPDKQAIAERFGATAIDYRALSPERYVALHTRGEGFDVIYDTVGGATIDASFIAVKRYTGHVVSCLGWSTHSLAPLSFRGATYSGVFTLLPLLTGSGQAHHGNILRQVAALADAGKLRPLLNEQRFSPANIAAAYALVECGALGKVVVEF